MSLGEFIPSSNTKLLLHLNGNSTDSSGNGNSGTDTAITYSQANGKFGQGAGFNGSSSRITIPANFAGGKLALAARRDLSQVSVYAVDAWTDISSITQNSGIWYLYSVIENHTDGKVYVYFNGSLISTINKDLGENLSFSMWARSVATTTSSRLRIFNADSTTVFNIGSWTSSDDFWNGSIDEVIIENRAWSASEVKKYFTQSRGFYATL